MRFNSKGITIVTSSALLVLVAAVLLTTTDSEAALSPNSTDAAAMRAVIERSYELRAVASRNFEGSQFPSVYSNDASAASLTSDEAELVQKVFPNSGNNIGLLDNMTAFYANWKYGAQQLEQLQAKAKSKGQELTAENFHSVGGPVGPPRRTDPIHKDTIRYDSFKAGGNRAEVILDDGAALQRVILVKRIGDWRIAGFTYINIHF
jgi:hypothetical protein